jgi:iron(III) transport system substrate-binding protein
MEGSNTVFNKCFAYLLLLSILVSAGVMFYLINPLPGFMKSGSGGLEELVVYSSERTEFMDCVLSLFEEKYNIPVKLVTGENEDLLTALKDETNASSVDVLMGVSPVELYGNESLFRSYLSGNRQYISLPDQQENDFSTVYLLSGNCIVVNKTLTKNMNITGYADLLKPELTGRIAMSDPCYSMMGFSHLINILEVEGGKDSEKAWGFYGSLLSQSKVSLSTEDVSSGVAKGKYAAGLAYDEVCASLLREGADIAVVYPAEGSLFMTKNAAILKEAPHPEYAELFIDFLISKEMQDIFGTVLTARPVRIVAQTSSYLSRLDSIPVVSADFKIYGESREELKNKYRESLVEVFDHE